MVNKPPDVYKMLVHPFGSTSSPYCANYALKRSVSDNKEWVSGVTLKIATGDIYVDDCIAAVGDIGTAKKVIKELREVTDKGGFK